MAELIAIYTAPDEGAPVVAHDRIEAITGVGLAGDRYAASNGTFSGNAEPRPGRAVTLIEVEAIEAAARDYNLALDPGDPRRNLVTRGVALNHLIGREFHVGDVVLRGSEMCEPCRYLEGLTREGVREAFIHRAGIRAEIVAGGTIEVGAPVTVPSPA